MPPLVDVFEIGPRSVERHERLEVRGAGFPPGRSASVSFRGVVNSPGERPAHVDILAQGKVTSDETLAIAFDETLENRFAARGGELRHGTFHGTVEVRFAVPGGAPVHGARDGIELDIRPKAHLDEDADERGRQVLAKLGATTSDDDDLLMIGELAPGGVAERHGLLPGDRIVEFAGVRVHGGADVSEDNVPRPLVIRYLRDGEANERSVMIDAPPFARALPTWVTFAMVGFAAFALLASLLVSRRLTRVRRFEIALGALLRERPSHPAQRRLPRGWRALATWAPALLLTLVLSITPLVPAWSELDVPTLFVAWLAARIVLTRPRGKATRSLGKILAWTTEALACVLPLSAVVVLAVHGTAALRIGDLGAAQAGWRWLAMQTPWMAAATAVVLMTTSQVRVDKPTALHRVADLLGVAILVLTVFGGWQPLQPGAGLAWLAPLAFLCKVVVVIAVQRGLRTWTERATGRVRESEPAALWSPLIAVAIVCGHFALGTPGWLAEMLAPSLLVLGAVATGAMLTRALGVPPGADDELDPTPN